MRSKTNSNISSFNSCTVYSVQIHNSYKIKKKGHSEENNEKETTKGKERPEGKEHPKENKY